NGVPVTRVAIRRKLALRFVSKQRWQRPLSAIECTSEDADVNRLDFGRLLKHGIKVAMHANPSIVYSFARVRNHDEERNRYLAQKVSMLFQKQSRWLKPVPFVKRATQND